MGTKTVNIKRHKAKAVVDEARDLLDRAVNRPGVREMADVYERWQALETAVGPYCGVTTPKRVVCLTDTSGPMVG